MEGSPPPPPLHPVPPLAPLRRISAFRSPPARVLNPVFALALTVAVTLLLPGCIAPESMAVREERLALAQLIYPADAQRGPDLDIAVERRGENLALLNRTARVYRDQQLWVNCQYVNIVPVIAVGPNNTIDLNRWVNQYAECFPVGAFLTPDKARAVVLAELYDPDTDLLTPLVVWPDNTQGDGR